MANQYKGTCLEKYTHFNLSIMFHHNFSIYAFVNLVCVLFAKYTALYSIILLFDFTIKLTVCSVGQTCTMCTIYTYIQICILV